MKSPSYNQSAQSKSTALDLELTASDSQVPMILFASTGVQTSLPSSDSPQAITGQITSKTKLLYDQDHSAYEVPSERASTSIGLETRAEEVYSDPVKRRRDSQSSAGSSKTKLSSATQAALSLPKDLLNEETAYEI
ncbi:unnamed protein product [Protopolystoma xenopodis]|uniref:Uncharacterized protein n=1 Tax=Protopolystoma xenopodis TaxID=117903 RepID=A0A448WN46_9PLAT|nr:unnamed protein product [Protopolystoma xenopodis]